MSLFARNLSLFLISALYRYTKALDNIKALRKDRVAELKAETERLESLSREKTHADKLKDRITEMNDNIAARTAEYEDLRRAYDQQVRSNQMLNDTGSKFREIYVKVDQLNQRRDQYKEELNLAKENLQEIDGMQNVRCGSTRSTAERFLVRN